MKLLHLSILIVASFCACNGQSSAPPARVVDDARRDAVITSLNDFFSGKWEEERIYLEPMELISSDLDRVGNYEAEVVTEKELQSRYAGKTVAPALARLHVEAVSTNAESDFRVSISYAGVPVVGAHAIPIGGGKTYWFDLDNGQAKLVREVSVEY